MKVKPTIFLSKEIVTNGNLSSEGMLAYVAIRSVCQLNIPLHVNADFLCSLFIIDKNKDYIENRKLKEKMNRGIQELIDKNLIFPLYALSKTSLVINSDALYVDKEKGDKFVVVYLSDIKTIMKLTNIQHDKLLFYLIQMSSTINSKTYIGFTGFDTLAERTNIARQTSYRFNQLLEENNIVYFNYEQTPIKYCLSKQVKNIKGFSF